MKKAILFLCSLFAIGCSDKTENINALDDYNRNKLFQAIVDNDQNTALKLIEQGINVNQQDIEGFTPLHFCAIYNRYEIAKSILENNGEVNFRNNYGNNALWTAVFESQKNKDYKLVKLLLTYKADINNINNANSSPLSFAKEVGYADLVKVMETQQ